jgi:hypothetical protein
MRKKVKYANFKLYVSKYLVRVKLYLRFRQVVRLQTGSK